MWEAAPACWCSAASCCGAGRGAWTLGHSLPFPVPLSRAGAGSTAPVLGHFPALRHGRHCRTAALKKPIACPAALLCSFPQQKGSDYNKTSQKMQGKGQGTFTGGTQSTRESLGSTAQFIKLLSGAPRTYSVYGAEGRGLKYLADLCDLGLQVHHVESQTMFELPSVTINIGDERAWKNLAARALHPHLLSSEQHSQPWGEAAPHPTAPSAASQQGLGELNLPTRELNLLMGELNLPTVEDEGNPGSGWQRDGAWPGATAGSAASKGTEKGKGSCSGLPVSYFLVYLVY